MTPAQDDRRRLLALVVALVVSGVALLGLAAGAGAQVDPCPITDPLCHSSVTTDPTTSTTRADEDSSSTTDDTVGHTSTTVRRRTTTTDDLTTTTARSVTVSTINDLLIPGDGTKGAESTTTTAKTLATGKSGLSDDQLIVLIVSGLGLLAVVFGLLTYRYWSATRPSTVER